jgi:hypothetical protein
MSSSSRRTSRWSTVADPVEVLVASSNTLESESESWSGGRPDARVRGSTPWGGEAACSSIEATLSLTNPGGKVVCVNAKCSFTLMLLLLSVFVRCCCCCCCCRRCCCSRLRQVCGRPVVVVRESGRWLLLLLFLLLLPLLLPLPLFLVLPLHALEVPHEV